MRSEPSNIKLKQGYKINATQLFLMDGGIEIFGFAVSAFSLNRFFGFSTKKLRIFGFGDYCGFQFLFYFALGFRFLAKIKLGFPFAIRCGLMFFQIICGNYAP